MKPFLLLATRSEDEAADDEYAGFLAAGGLLPEQLHRVRLEAAAAAERIESVGALPDPVLEDNESGEFAIGLEYLEAVVNYVCYRARSKDAEDGQSGDAVAFYGAFEASLGAKNESSNAASPNQPANSV